MPSSCELSPSEQQQIRQWIAAHGTPPQVALRCRIVLAAAEGHSDVAIAHQLAINRKTVILWRRRFVEQRLDGLWEVAPGRGCKPTYDSDTVAAIVEATLHTKPAGMTHWSCRTMAKHQGVSKSTINTVWQARHLQPHRVETFKLSRDPRFLEKLTDVVGLYVNPPDQAIVLCVDEKSQIQARDRTQPGCRSRAVGRPCGAGPRSEKEPHVASATALMLPIVSADAGTALALARWLAASGGTTPRSGAGSA